MNSYNGFTPYQRTKGDKKLKAAVEAGIIKSAMEQSCSMCGQDKGIRHLHCEDYSEENIVSDAVCLCWRCHMMLHTRFYHPKSWHKYFCDVVLHKKQYPPVYRPNDWDVLKEHYID